jgi:hypothetical protein
MTNQNVLIHRISEFRLFPRHLDLINKDSSSSNEIFEDCSFKNR